jgi:hypothetical protein
MFGEFTTPLSRVVESFEEDMQIPAGPKQYLADWNERKSLGQKAVPLRPGTYRLVLACKDDVFGNAHNYEATVAVPHFDADKLSTSALILADAIEAMRCGTSRLANS